LLAAAALSSALAAAMSVGLFSTSPSGTMGGIMIVSHALAVLAVVTVVGEAVHLSDLGRELKDCRALPDDRRTGWPIVGLDDALKRLYRRHSTEELRAEIRKTEGLILDRQQWTWMLAQMVAFLIPAVGFAASLWNLRLEGNKLPYRELGWPLFTSLGEALLVLLLALWVRGVARTLARDWSSFCQQLCVIRRPEGDKKEGLGEEELEDKRPVDSVVQDLPPPRKEEVRPKTPVVDASTPDPNRQPGETVDPEKQTAKRTKKPDEHYYY